MPWCSLPARPLAGQEHLFDRAGSLLPAAAVYLLGQLTLPDVAWEDPLGLISARRALLLIFQGALSPLVRMIVKASSLGEPWHSGAERRHQVLVGSV